MTSYLFDLPPLEEAGATLVSDVGHKLQDAIIEERKLKRLTKQNIATTLGVNRSHVHRLLSGHYNLTLISLAEIALAIGREVHITLPKIQDEHGCNYHREADSFWGADEGKVSINEIRRGKKTSTNVIKYEYQNG